MSVQPLNVTSSWSAPPRLISDEYKAAVTKMHEETPHWGIFGQKYANLIRELYGTFGFKSILDYGCGKRSLQQALGFQINNYDPGIPECAARPSPADLVVCTDVLEHIEPDMLDAVLDDIRSLTLKKVFLTIATIPAVQILPDGRNAHLIVQPYTYWLPILWLRWTPVSIGIDKKRIVYIGDPK